MLFLHHMSVRLCNTCLKRSLQLWKFQKPSRHIFTISALWSHYKTLRVKQNATKEEIKAAYIELTKKHHPDAKSLNDSDTQEFLKITEAYKILSDSSSRTRYDITSFGMSHDFNRFSSGEYELPKDRNYRKKKMEVEQDPAHESPWKMMIQLSPEARRVLDYLIGVLSLICILMYATSRYQRKHNENNDDK